MPTEPFNSLEAIWTPRKQITPMTRIKMVSSVGGKFTNGERFDLVAGKEYWIDAPKADEFIIKGFASGNLSREYSDDEVAELRAQVQRLEFTPDMLKVVGRDGNG